MMRSSVGQCRNIRFRQLYASHVIIASGTNEGGKNKFALLLPLKLYPFTLKINSADLEESGLEIFKEISCFTQMSMNLILLINVKMPTNNLTKHKKTTNNSIEHDLFPAHKC